jgi:catechol 2,3-dioxygenase-like lactoylglutathione lyase family enzyme
MDYRLEVVFVPVSDVDRAKHFYADQVGFHVDHDQSPSDTLRFVQLTPPGSACSIAFGTGLTDRAPGTTGPLMLVVDDADAVHAELAGRGVPVSEIDEQPWGRFVYFRDPDGNTWNVQEIVRPKS